MIEGGIEVVADGIEPTRIDAAVSEGGVHEPVGRIHYEDEMMIEIGLQPLSNIDLDPIDIEVESDLAIGRFRIGDGVNLAQHALAVIVQRASEQLALGRNRDLVGALRGAQYGNHDANDRDGDDDADRDHDATARMVAAAACSSFTGIRWSQSQLAVPLGLFSRGP